MFEGDDGAFGRTERLFCYSEKTALSGDTFINHQFMYPFDDGSTKYIHKRHFLHS